MSNWSRAGIRTVLSLLTPEEEEDLDLGAEKAEAESRGMDFLAFPIPDRQVPYSEAAMTSTVEALHAALSAGKDVVVHCRQGVGRAGLVSACLLVFKGLSAEDAVARLGAARRAPIPETPEQRRWIDGYAANFAGAR
jgi:protein-tyrosine phosphatase